MFPYILLVIYLFVKYIFLQFSRIFGRSTLKTLFSDSRPFTGSFYCYFFLLVYVSCFYFTICMTYSLGWKKVEILECSGATLIIDSPFPEVVLLLLA